MSAPAGRRLPPRPGEWIDRSRPIAFRFEGRDYRGLHGDTVSSALLAAGVQVLGRSFKYHRPRGVYSLTGADANVMLEGPAGVNLRGDELPLADGLDLRAVNTLGGVRRDLLAVLGRLSAFTPVGFYYKAMHTPRWLSPLYERGLRALAGLGRVPGDGRRGGGRRPPPSPKDYAFCDVLVVGAGPAGVAAANAAAEQGAAVMLVESSGRLDGSVTEAVGSGVERRFGAACVGVYADLWAAVVDARRLTKVRARSLVVAAGCQDQPAVFGNNDLPGVMLGEAARRLMERYAVRPADRPLVLTAGSGGYRLADAMAERGIGVAAVVDLRAEAPGDGAPAGGASGAAGATEAARETEAAGATEPAGAPVYRGHAVVEALPLPGNAGVRAARIRALDAAGRPTGPARTVPCDGIIVCVGAAPRDGLLRQAGAAMAYDETLHRHVPDELPAGVFAAGSVAGVGDAAGDGVVAAAADGRRAGRAAAAHAGRAFAEAGAGAPAASGPPAPEPVEPAEPGHPYPIFAEPDAKANVKAFVDLDEDVTVDDLAHAVQEGFDHPELLKRYATVGMGPSQGQHANVNAARVLARLTGRPLAGARLTTARPFTTPVPMAHLAGRGFTPVQRTPVHDRHERLGARMTHAGAWLRPAWYPREGLDRAGCIDAEARDVRSRVGLIDVGTLGKLEVSGTDAVRFLERVYAGRFARLRIGMTRYGVLCDESGVVIDDGVVARLDADRFYVSTTSSGADQVYRELQRWAAVWRLDVTLVNATGSYGACNVAGPYARHVLAGLTDIDLSPDAFPYLGIREGAVAGAPARVSRVGFVGELGYEVHVPAGYAAGVWDELLRAGRGHGIVPFGVEAQRLLRLEKGHLIVGQDTDGLTDPFEADLGWAVKLDKRFFVGKRSLQIIAGKEPRRRLVGFELPADAPAPRESHLIVDAGGGIDGRVTSVGRSGAVGRTIGLAYVPPAAARVGAALRIKGDGGAIAAARVAATPFFDPDGARLRS